MRLLRASFPDRPALDVALGSALLARAQAAGAGTAVLRVSRPGPTLAFGRLDRLRPGFPSAVAVARAHGFTPVLRAPGGHAAAYHHGTVVVEWVGTAADAVAGVQPRFAELAERLAGALRTLGADARIGPVAGEYCPGRWSVNGAERVKLAGTAQRVVRGAWLAGAELVAEDGEPVRAVLADVYAALELPFDVATAAAVEELAPGVTVDDVERAVVEAFPIAARTPLDAALVAEAEALEPRHALEEPPRRSNVRDAVTE